MQGNHCNTLQGNIWVKKTHFGKIKVFWKDKNI